MLLPLSPVKFAMPWPTSKPGSRITTRPHPSLDEQEDHVVGSVRQHLVHRSVDNDAGAVRAHEDTRARVCRYPHRFGNTTKKFGEKLYEASMSFDIR